MSETKRRNKKTEPDAPERAGAPRQTRVTLAKDVSSKYRKIMPRYGGAPAGDGGAPPKRRGPAASTRPARSPRGSSETSDFGRPARPPRSSGGSDRPTRPPRSSAGSDRPPRPPRSSAGAGRAPSARPARDSMDPTVFKAIVHREMPEAAKQVRETREVLLAAAEDILSLAEKLSAIHDSLGSRLSETDNSALAADLATARTVVTRIFEKISFQDLAGQRLMKVDDFFKSLGEALKKPSFQAGRKSAPRRDGGERRPRVPRSENPEKKSRLKGPQAAGEGLAQNDVDKLLVDL